MTINKIWGMINRIEVKSPKETLKRCKLAEQFIVKCDCPELMIEDWKGNYPFDEMMEAIGFIKNSAYQRMRI